MKPSAGVMLGLLTGLFLSTGLCGAATAGVGGSALIGVGGDGWNFADGSTGGPFVPVGVNYYDPDTGWAPRIWELFDAKRVDDHFAKMSELGLNTARIFLTAQTFQPDATAVSEDALAKLDSMVSIARRHGIRLILTGPDHWEGRPTYWGDDKYAADEALEALQVFWSVVAKRYADEPTIMAWDLLNEPMLGWTSASMAEKWNTWVKAQYASLEALHKAWPSVAPSDLESQWEGTMTTPANTFDVDPGLLYDYQIFRDAVAREWVKVQVDAIRATGDKHLVTIGFIQYSFPLKPVNSSPSGYAAFDPAKLGDLLDFSCLHFYPPADPEGPSKQQSLDYLRAALNYCRVPGKPLVLEEFGWYGGGNGKTEGQQDDWNSAVLTASKGLVSGWLPWPLFDTPSSTDLSKFGGLLRFDGGLKQWGQSFVSFAQRTKGVPASLESTLKSPQLDWKALLVAPYPGMYLSSYLKDSGLTGAISGTADQPAALGVPVGTELLMNAGFEEGKTVPKSWQASIGNGKGAYEKDGVFEGLGAVSIAVPDGKPIGWPLWSQKVKLPMGVSWVQLEAKVRTEGVKDGYGAYLALEYLDKKGNRISVAQSECVAGTEDWTTLRAASEVPTGAASISANLLLNARGKAIFDAASLTVLR